MKTFRHFIDLFWCNVTNSNDLSFDPVAIMMSCTGDILIVCFDCSQPHLKPRTHTHTRTDGRTRLLSGLIIHSNTGCLKTSSFFLYIRLICKSKCKKNGIFMFSGFKQKRKWVFWFGEKSLKQHSFKHMLWYTHDNRQISILMTKFVR